MKIIENLRVFYENNGKLCNYSQYKGKFSILLPLLAKKNVTQKILHHVLKAFYSSRLLYSITAWAPARRASGTR